MMSSLLLSLWASLNRIAAVAGKEFVALLKDKGSRLILVVPVIVQSILFGYGATFNGHTVYLYADVTQQTDD